MLLQQPMIQFAVEVCTVIDSVTAARPSNSALVELLISTNTATATLLPFVPTISELNYKYNHCEYSFKNQKGHIVRTQKLTITPKKKLTPLLA